MNKIINYFEYNITSTSQFDNAISQLRDNNYTKELKKLFRIIDEIIEGADMYESEYARPLKNSKKMMHIHLDGRTIGDIILLYKVDGHDIDLDLRLHNITNHKLLDRSADPKFTSRQKLHPFDVIRNKYTDTQLDCAENCYLDLISDYKLHQLKGQQKTDYSNNYLRNYFNTSPCEDDTTFEEFMQLINYFEHLHHTAIFGSLDLGQSQHTIAFTAKEESYIMQIFDDYDIEVDDAYVQTEVDEYGDTYQYMYVVVVADNYREMRLLQSELYSLEQLFEVTFRSFSNGLGRCGRTFEFAHYFE